MSVHSILIKIICGIVICETNCSIISNNVSEAAIQVFQQQENDHSDDQICSNQMMNLMQELLKGQFWAINAVDSWGKIPSGILSGNSYELGNFDQCLDIAHSKEIDSIDKDFVGKYCLSNVIVDTPAGLTSSANLKQINFLNQLEQNLLIDHRQDAVLQKLILNVGICIPQACSPTFLTNKLNVVLELVGNITQTPGITKILINEEFCQIKRDVEFSSMDIFAICFFSIIAALMVLSTAYDITMTRQKRTKNLNLIAFSMFTNCEKIFKCNQTKSPDVMDCINGIRVLSIVWVVFGHAYTSFVGVSVNMLDLYTWLQNPYSMVLMAGTVAVDTFFMLSGLLVAYSMLKHLDSKNGKINIPLLYVHRYLRLTPALAAAVLLCSTLFRHIASGPLWEALSPQKSCEISWWSILLYVQNYVSPKETCIGPIWYLMVDMQLFILSPLIIFPLWRWRSKFVWTIPILIVISMSCTFTVFMINHFRAYMMGDDVGKYEKTYVATHTRFGAWGIGVLVGYILHITKSKRLQLSNVFIFSGWILALGGIFSIIFGFYPMMQPGAIISDLESAFYETLSRVCWAICVGWIIFACVHGYGGPINWFLSLPQWQPLARLSYCVYLLHTIIQLVELGSMRTMIYFNDFNAIHKFWGDFGLTLCISVIWTMAFESPILTLEKLLLGKSTKGKNEISTIITNKAINGK